MTSNAPIAMITKPFFVHSGLLYMEELDGPTNELLCIIKIVPDTTRIIPAMIKYFLYFVRFNIFLSSYLKLCLYKLLIMIISDK